jgi:hypothetical protein
MGMKYRLLQPILDYPTGYVVSVHDGNGWLGLEPEWKIPVEIMDKNTEWFVKQDQIST